MKPSIEPQLKESLHEYFDQVIKNSTIGSREDLVQALQAWRTDTNQLTKPIIHEKREKQTEKTLAQTSPLQQDVIFTEMPAIGIDVNRQDHYQSLLEAEGYQSTPLPEANINPKKFTRQLGAALYKYILSYKKFHKYQDIITTTRLMRSQWKAHQISTPAFIQTLTQPIVSEGDEAVPFAKDLKIFFNMYTACREKLQSAERLRDSDYWSEIMIPDGDTHKLLWLIKNKTIQIEQTASEE